MTAALLLLLLQPSNGAHTRARTQDPRPRAVQTIHFMNINRERTGATCCTPHKGRPSQGRDAHGVVAAAVAADTKYSNTLLTLHSTSAAGTRPSTPKLNNLRSFCPPLSAQSVPPSVHTAAAAAAAAASRRLSESSTLTRKEGEDEEEEEEGEGCNCPPPPPPPSSDWLLPGE